MSKLNDLKIFLASKETHEEGKQIIETAAKAFTGDLDALKELLEKIVNGPAFYKNISFIEKFKVFLNGVLKDEDDIRILSEIIANGNEADNAERILDCIDSIETTSKAKYLINITRSYMCYERGMNGIDKCTYYRFIYVIKNILIEDIEFVQKKIKLREVDDCDSAVALEKLGLMYVTTSRGGVRYAFSDMAYKFLNEAIIYDDENCQKIFEPKDMPVKYDMGSEWDDIEMKIEKEE